MMRRLSDIRGDFVNPSKLFLLAAFAAAVASADTLTGTVSDAMCGAKHMMANASPAQCVRECVKAGSEYALVSNGKVYTLKGGDKKALDKYAGQKVTVSGKVNGDTMDVTSVVPAN